MAVSALVQPMGGRNRAAYMDATLLIFSVFQYVVHMTGYFRLLPRSILGLKQLL